MSYEVTATRRRPQRFEDLIGQEFVAATLKNSIQSGKIAHAYLFSGPRGCGKTSTARILAKALNCKNGPTPSPCGTCTSCQEITKGSSMDVIEIDGASNTSVNDVRQIKDEVQFPPQSGRYKIYIIDEVHMLSVSAFNALLKTIEEPPPYVIFIFATTELQKVPATIKSRCQQFNFRLVPVEQVKSLLADAAKEIQIQADDEALYWIARESTGSIRDAYTLFDQVAAFSDGHITYEKIRDKLGLVGVDRLNDLLGCCAQGKTADVLTKLDEYLQAGISIEQLISNSADYLRSMLLLKNGITKEALLGQTPERFSKEVLAAWNPVQIERALSLFLQLYRDIRYSLSPRYELELAFSRLCWLKEYVSPAEVKNAIDAAHALLKGAPVTSAPPAAGIPADSAAQSRTQEVHAQQPETQSTPEAAPAAHASADIPGLPRFSALAGAPAGDTAPQIQAESPHPFNDGGAEPPEKAAAVIGPPPVHDDTESGYAPDGEMPPDEYEEDAGCPEDDSAADETSADENPSGAMPAAADTLPEQEPPAAEPQPAAQPGTAADTGSGLTKLRGKLIAELSVSDGFTASMLMQTGDWIQDGSTVKASVDTAFKKGQLDKQAAVISGYLSRISGTSMVFTAVLAEKEAAAQQSQQLPQQVDMLCRVFRGNVVGGKQ